MSSTQPKAIFDSFNARFLEPREVASTFVPSEQFDLLIQKNHSLVIGPRGSGKTTLLTMLQRQALDAWHADEATRYVDKIGFTGVFIPTDVSWGKQLSMLGCATFEPAHQELFTIAAFTTHILRRLVMAMEYEVGRAGNALSSTQEAEIARQLSSAWHIGDACVSLRSLKYALTLRLNELKAYASREALRGREGRAERLASDHALHLSFLDCVSFAIDVFDDARGMPTAKWGLLFDELELAPIQIRKALVQSLRSVNERLLFKLSLAPFAGDLKILTDAIAASASNDFTIVQLWYSHKEQGQVFCRSLWRQMTAARGLRDADPEQVLGRSVFDTDVEEWAVQKTAYHSASRLAKRFESLRRKDVTFDAFLTRQGINLDELETLEPNRRAATVRKATSIVAIRDAVLASGRTEGTEPRRRSREVLDIYSGASAMFAMVEGNPRWFKAIIGELLSDASFKDGAVARPLQARAISRAVTRFRALLRTIPCPPVVSQKRTRGLLTLLDIVGNYFASELISKDFNLDPPNSFCVHSRCTDEMIESLGQALNAGALVLLPDDQDDVVGASLRGKKLRLSYLFASYYPTLLRAGRSISLSTIIDRSSNSAGATDGGDAPLFGEMEDVHDDTPS